MRQKDLDNPSFTWETIRERNLYGGTVVNGKVRRDVIGVTTVERTIGDDDIPAVKVSANLYAGEAFERISYAPSATREALQSTLSGIIVEFKAWNFNRKRVKEQREKLRTRRRGK